MQIDPKDVAAFLLPLLDKAVAAINNPFLTFAWKIARAYLQTDAGVAAMHAAATKP